MSTERTQRQDRIEKWDLLKALLIFLVVLGHFTDYYTPDSSKMRALFLFIYSFHMPCFLFADGLFSKNTINKNNYSRIFSYLCIYIAAKMLNTFVHGIVNHTFSFSLFSEDAFPWYGLTLFWCCLITIFLKQFSRKWILCAAILFACFAGYDNDISDFLVLSRTIVYYPFFFLGYCTDYRHLEKATSSWRAKLTGVLILVVTAVFILLKIDDIYFIRPLLTGRNPYSALTISEDLKMWGGLLRLAYYPVVLFLCMAVIAVIPSNVSPACTVKTAESNAHTRSAHFSAHFSYTALVEMQTRTLHFFAGVGRRSLQIYLLHRPVLYILYNGFHLNDFMTRCGVPNLVIIPLAFLLTLVLSPPVLEKPVRAVIYPGKRKESFDGSPSSSLDSSI